MTDTLYGRFCLLLAILAGMAGGYWITKHDWVWVAVDVMLGMLWFREWMSTFHLKGK